ncbi:MAG TPA: SPW repeat protein [Candidatus Paceibacterota bacterium]|nr:SPW repeat protein [Candidatus Paceibacterota bacterium]
MRWFHWVIAALGLWIFVSPWILGYSGINLMLWNNLLAGGLIFIFALWNFTPPEE